MAGGYTLHLLEVLENADPENIGVRLGRMCVTRRIPVPVVAKSMGVTRAAVYKWFKGQVVPQPAARERIEAFMEEMISNDE